MRPVLSLAGEPGGPALHAGHKLLGGLVGLGLLREVGDRLDREGVEGGRALMRELRRALEGKA